jgi:N-glycosylase/DNA lyase
LFKTEPAPAAASVWQSLALSKTELRLMVTLMSGQSFRWQRITHVCDALTSVAIEKLEMPEGAGSGDGVFSLVDYCVDGAIRQDYMGVVGAHTFVLREFPNDVLFCAFGNVGAVLREDVQAECKAVLRAYLQAEVNRSQLDSEWLSLDSPVDCNFERRLPFFPGVRVLSLDLWEAIVSFVGSANNNIKRYKNILTNDQQQNHNQRLCRTAQMIQRLCGHFAENFICELGGDRHFSFPSLAQMSKLSEQDLLDLGWGYRAPRVCKLCNELNLGGGVKWLTDLRSCDRSEAAKRLRKLTGIGPKVADCICLFSLKLHDTIPVDTHCWQFALRSYTPKLRDHTINERFYHEIGDTLRSMFGEMSGWAFMVLFVAEVHPFRKCVEHLLVHSWAKKAKKHKNVAA